MVDDVAIQVFGWEFRQFLEIVRIRCSLKEAQGLAYHEGVDALEVVELGFLVIERFGKINNNDSQTDRKTNRLSI